MVIKIENMLERKLVIVVILLSLIPLLFVYGNPKLKASVSELLSGECKGSKYATMRDTLFKDKKEDAAQTIRALKNENKDNVTLLLLNVLLQRIKDIEGFGKTEKALSEAIQKLNLEKVTSPQHGVMLGIRRFKRFYTRSEMKPAIGISPEKYSNLIPVLIEIALKGWHEEDKIKILSDIGWGPDIYREIAIHMLGDFKYKPALPLLLKILYDNNEPEYARTYAMWSTARIADASIIKKILIDKTDKLKNISGINYNDIDKNTLLQICFEIITESKKLEARKLAFALLYKAKDLSNYEKTLSGPMKKIIENKEEHITIRNMAKGVLGELAMRQMSEEEKKEIEKKKWIMRKRLLFQDITRYDLGMFKYNQKQGKISKQEAEQIIAKYLETVKYIAAQYASGNVFATGDLHDERWPDTVQHAKGRVVFQRLKSLSAGMDIKEVTKKFQYEIKFIYKMEISDKVAHWSFNMRIDKKIEGPFGNMKNSIEADLIFKEGKLLVVHVPHW